ncbi:MAG: AIM24 family protein, partial [Pirellula sp.]
MQVDIRNRPSFANLLVQFQPGDKIIAEAGAMATMSSNVEMKTRLNGGFF